MSDRAEIACVVKELLNRRTKSDLTQHHYLVLEREILRAALEDTNAQILKAGGMTVAKLRRDGKENGVDLRKRAK